MSLESPHEMGSLETAPGLPPRSLTHSFYSPFKVARELFKGKTLYRALVNLSLNRMEISGRVLDIGSKSMAASYFRWFRIRPGTVVTCSDLNPSDGVVGINVEKTFPQSDGSFDVVLAINLFEHVMKFEVAPVEIHRILAPGGQVIVVVPFMHEVHPDPGDYFRYTDECLEKIWKGAGFDCVSMEAVGEGILGFALTKYLAQVMPAGLAGPLAAVAYVGCALLDRVAALRPKVNARTVPQRFPLGYVVRLRKSG